MSNAQEIAQKISADPEVIETCKEYGIHCYVYAGEEENLFRFDVQFVGSSLSDVIDLPISLFEYSYGKGKHYLIIGLAESWRQFLEVNYPKPEVPEHVSDVVPYQRAAL